MRRANFVLVVVVAICFGGALKAAARENDPADYALRVHVYEDTLHPHPDGGADGAGRANLYEQGQPRGFDYKFDCSQVFRHSVGYETYLARWRKRDAELELLLPAKGKPGEYKPCSLKVVMKNAVYVIREGKVGEEPAAKLKAWMVEHNYDPERGKNQPTGLGHGPAQGAAKVQ